MHTAIITSRRRRGLAVRSRNTAGLLVVIAVALFIAAIVVLVVAIRRPKTPATPGGRRDPLAFDAMPQFGPRQLGPGAIVSHGGIDYVAT